MPRKGVPYGGGICSLKERIAEIWDKLGEKLHSINGVEGDGAGNVQIVSGDDAVVINNDQIGHKIKVSLDNSKLPSAAVTSVNGETGAVVLNAGNIPTQDKTNVQTYIDVGKEGLQNCIQNIIAEREARQNADAALQTNINAAQASIPKMSITPDPYKAVERDAQGRAFAADPTSGATDKTLVTANWVSQTGDSGPNNLVHKIGSETINGVKIFSVGIQGYNNNFHSTNITGQAINDISLFARLDNSSHGKYIIFDAIQSSNTDMCAGQFMVQNRTDNMAAMWLWRKWKNNISNPIIGNCLVIANKNGEYYLGWRKLKQYGSIQVRDNLAWSYLTINSYPTNQIEWIDKINIGTGDGYIITEVGDASAYTE